MYMYLHRSLYDSKICMDNIGLYTHTNVGAKSQMQNGDKENAEKHSRYTILALCKNVTKIDNIDINI